MRKVSMKLENCYGIQKMEHEIDFSENNISVIYAPNGTMKSSLAKTFDSISKGEDVEERIFGYKSRYSITDENGTILPESIIVVNPFNKEDCNKQGLLMANAELRKKYVQIHKTIDDKKTILFANIKSQLGYTVRSGFDVEMSLLSDWQYEKKKVFECLEEVNIALSDPTMCCDLNVKEINHSLLFNDKVIAMITTGETAELIEAYEKKYAELIEKSLYMQKGIIDHNNYANISKSLYENGFFGAKNEITLIAKDGSESKIVKSYEELNKLIQQEKEKILSTKELKDLFEKINKLIDKNKETRTVNGFLQKHPEIVIEYRNIQLFKKKIWVKVFNEFKAGFEDLLEEYQKAKIDLEKLRLEAKKETTEWNQVLELFKERFFVPFDIVADNQEDVILNMDMPSFKYIFKDARDSKEIVKEKLLEVLSTGEERAYYILNMIFRITIAQQDGKEKIIILDDISESFDYKNKYAIIEYLNDISSVTNECGNKIFKLLVLTHNFDFYRTVSSRLRCKGNAYIAYLNESTVCLNKREYLETLFEHFKTCVVKGKGDKYIAATIPFVRNLIEYVEGKKHNDYIKLTNVLHYKPETMTTTLKMIEDIYNSHWLRSKPVSFSEKREETLICDLIYNEADKIPNVELLEIENKLILSMAIRLKAEKYVTDEIKKSVVGGKEIIDEIYTQHNQTGKLIRAYKKHIGDEKVKILEQVSMMTAENIHLNSFMFEPILDMSLKHLYSLYQEVSTWV